MSQEAREYILDQLNDLYTRFEGIKIRYEFNVDLYVHIIEVLPLHIFEEKQDYILAEMKIEEEFQTLFEDEEILFVSEGSLNQIEEASFSLGYEENILTYTIDIDSGLFDNLELFDDYINYHIYSGNLLDEKNKFEREQETSVIESADFALAA